MNQSLSIEGFQTGFRLDAFLASEMPELSRSQWKGLIQSGAVTLNGASCKPNQKLQTGDELAWSIPEAGPAEAQPEDIPITVLFEDDAVLVLNKQSGLVIHPANGNETGTLVNALLFYDPGLGSLDRAGIVHRLDKGTTGVMVVAKTEDAAIELKRQFKERETEKDYLAIVWGKPPKSGRIETQVGRHPMHRKKQAVLREGGRTAISSFKTLEQFDGAALVQVNIETGRTHQIRIHMTYVKHPVIGDSTYGRARHTKLPFKPERQMLHAATLAFTHPSTGKRLSFEAPLFDDMRQFLELLRNK